jgi:hypothetical protein
MSFVSVLMRWMSARSASTSVFRLSMSSHRRHPANRSKRSMAGALLEAPRWGWLFLKFQLQRTDMHGVPHLCIVERGDAKLVCAIQGRAVS